jgi:adenylylsulfate kinase
MKNKENIIDSMMTVRDEAESNRFILWIMGPTSSGKTTIACHVLRKLRDKSISAIHFDGDEVRDFFGPKFGFSNSDRLRVVGTIVHLSNKAFDSGLSVVVSALTANQDARDYIKQNVKNLILIYLNCSVERCMERDPKGLYSEAAKGKIQTLIGVNSDYIPVDNPDIIINTENETVDVCVEKIYKWLQSRDIIE